MNKLIAIVLCALFLLSGCSNAAAGTVLEMELTESYDAADPFIQEKLFYVSDNVDTLELAVSFQMEGEKGVLEIADNETKEVVWSNTWTENTDKTTVPVTLENLAKEKEYVVRFTGTQIKHAKIVLTSENSLVKERERPLKPNKTVS